MWHEFRQRHPGAGVKDEHGVWDVPERVHWDERLAASIGMPGPYDYGPQRIAWFDHRVADWAGDDAWMDRLSVRLTAPNFVGDTTWIRGSVADKPEPGMVTLELRAEDQRGAHHRHGYRCSDTALPGLRAAFYFSGLFQQVIYFCGTRRLVEARHGPLEVTFQRQASPRVCSKCSNR